MEDSPTYGVSLIASPPTALSFEELVATAATKTWALGTHYLCVVKARHTPAYSTATGNPIPAQAQYRAAVYDLRTASFSQPNGTWLTEAQAETCADCLRGLVGELAHLEAELALEPTHFGNQQVASHLALSREAA